jgi:hypothetical protein
MMENPSKLITVKHTSWFLHYFIDTDIKRPRNEADHSPLPSAKVRNGGTYLLSPIHLHGMVLN